MTTPGVPSPCVSICRMDAASGWCTGCMRTLQEIGAWSVLDEAGKRAVWAQLVQRRVQWRARPAAAAQPLPPGGAAPGA